MSILDKILGKKFAVKNTRGTMFFLHTMNIKLKSNGKKQAIYYFAKTENKTRRSELPAGYTIRESKSGLPYLKKI